MCSWQRWRTLSFIIHPQAFTCTGILVRPFTGMLSTVERCCATRCDILYKPPPPVRSTPATTAGIFRQVSGPQLDLNKYARLSRSRDSLPSPPSEPFDLLQRYLDEPLVSEEEIQAAGGLIPFIESQCARRPCLSQFQLDVLTGPSTSLELHVCGVF
jgi:hypothetical protein